MFCSACSGLSDRGTSRIPIALELHSACDISYGKQENKVGGGVEVNETGLWLRKFSTQKMNN